MFAQGIFQQDPSASPESLQRRRELFAAMMPRYGSARYTGEGLGQLFTGIARGAAHRNLDRQEGKERDRITEAFGRIFSGGGTATGGAPILGQSYQPPDPNSPEGIAGDTMAALGRGSPYADAIASVESAGSGDYSAIGPTTKSGDKAYGRYQVMGSNVGPWTEKYLGKRMTPDEFLASPGAQDAVFNGEFGSYVSKYGNPQDAASMWFSGRPMSAAGNASDGYNTVPQYVDKFNQALGGPERVTQASSLDVQTLADIASSPYATAGQRATAQAFLQQQMQAMDPRSALELENMRLQNEALKNPQRKDDRTSDQKEYDRAALEYIQRGEPVPTFTDWTRGNKASGAANQTVTVGGESSRIGTIPQGYSVVVDPNEPSGYRMVAIPGGPEDTSASAAAAASNAATASEVVTTAAQRAREAAQKRDFGAAGTSFIAGLPIIGAGTDSGEVVRQVDVLKSQAAAGNLQAMRDASKTGGALGNVTEKELKLLQDKSGALDPNSPTFLRDLDDYERTLLRIVHGQEVGDAIFEQTRGGADSEGWQTINGVKIRVKQ